MKFLFMLTAALAAAQPASQVYCKASQLNSRNMKGLYGGRTEMFQTQIECRNYGLAPAQIDGIAMDLSLPTINSLPSAQASALLTKTFNGQPGQQMARDASIGLGVLGALEAGGGKVGAFLSVGPFGLIVAAVMTVTQYVIPLFTANEPPLNFTNQCDQISAGMMLAPGASITCMTYIQKPPKGATPLPGAFTFNLVTAPPTPGPLPPAPPVQLRPGMQPLPDRSGAFVAPHCWTDQNTTERICVNGSGVTYRPDLPAGTPNVIRQGAVYRVDPDGSLDHLTYARKLYYAGDYRGSVREYNAAIREHDSPDVWIESAGALYNDGPEARELSEIVLEHFQDQYKEKR